MTVNGALCAQKALVQRRTQLNEVKNASTQREYFLDDGNKTSKEPTYDIKQVDKKIVAINNALFKMDQAIKESNAKIQIDLNIDLDALMSPLE